MSSGFVSGGTNPEPPERDDEWHRAQQELEEERRQKAELGRQEGGKSLYDVLQQNKMAKQEAFEESIRLKNQFRSLDEDEVEFLDSLLESTRAKEAAVKKETAEQLEAFHRQRQEADKALLEAASADTAKAPGEAASPGEEEQWSISGRKRRRDKKKELLIPGKRRKSSAAENAEAPSSAERKTSTSSTVTDTVKIQGEGKSPVSSSTLQSQPKPKVSENYPTAASKPVQSTTVPGTSPSVAKQPADRVAPLSLGLAGYSSDEDSS